MEGPPLGPGGEDITWPDQVAPRGRKASSTRKIKPQTSNLNAGQCVRQPREGRRRNRQAPPPKKKKKEGGGGKGTKTAHSRQTARQHHHRRPNPPQEVTEDRTPTEAQGDHPPKTGNTKPVTAAHGEKGHRNGKKKKKGEQPAQPERKGMEGQGPQSPGKKNKKNKRKNKSAKNTPRQPSQEGLGTAETRAQHTRPHRTPEPETAGGKRGAHETTHVPKAGRNRSPTTNTTNSRH